MPAGLQAVTLAINRGEVFHAEVRRGGEHDWASSQAFQRSAKVSSISSPGGRGVSQRRENRPVHIVDQQGVAVGRRAGHRIVADLAAGARLVLDDDRLAEHAPSRSVKIRAKPSTNPPAANGTMTLIGCSGNSARAGAGGKRDQQRDKRNASTHGEVTLPARGEVPHHKRLRVAIHVHLNAGTTCCAEQADRVAHQLRLASRRSRDWCRRCRSRSAACPPRACG